MEHVSLRDNNPSPHRTPAAPLIQADSSLLTPNRREPDVEYPAWPSPPSSTTSSQYADKPRFLKFDFEPPRSKPLFRGFERPSFSRIAILTALCLITYPAFYILTLVAKDKSLFVVRFILSVWCSGVGFALGYVLLRVGAQHLEAASEFTSIAIGSFSYFISNSLGHRDSYGLRKWRNETPGSGQKLK